MSNDLVKVSEDIVDIVKLNHILSDNTACGAIATFVGLVRDNNLGNAVTTLTLEHYPGMTEKVLNDICQKARDKWTLGDIVINHRVGDMKVGEVIVFVGVNSAHRQNAFDACAYIMDILKTSAPFWKKEATDQGTRWVKSRDSDKHAADKWNNI